MVYSAKEEVGSGFTDPYLNCVRNRVRKWYQRTTWQKLPVGITSYSEGVMGSIRASWEICFCSIATIVEPILHNSRTPENHFCDAYDIKWHPYSGGEIILVRGYRSGENSGTLQHTENC